MRTMASMYGEGAGSSTPVFTKQDAVNLNAAQSVTSGGNYALYASGRFSFYCRHSTADSLKLTEL